MLIMNGKNETFRTDEYGESLLSAFAREPTYITFELEVDGFFEENSILLFKAKKYSANGDVIDTIDIIGKPVEPLHPHIKTLLNISKDIFASALPQHLVIKEINRFVSDVDIAIGYNIFADTNYMRKVIPNFSQIECFDIFEMLLDFFPAKELNSYCPEDVFDLFSIEHSTIGYSESINEIFNILLSKYMDYFTNKPDTPLTKMHLTELYYKVEPPRPRQLYLNTNIGQFCFNLKTMTYKLRRSRKFKTITEIDMEYLRKLVLNHFKITDDVSLYLLLSRKSEYKAILN